MMRSLFSGVSGLRIHQTKMDVIANNISNVNTIGFKSSRVTFTDVFYQRIQGASAANEETGRAGVNPMQIGLGASVSSIDNVMTQGAAQRTDNATDIMVQGNGFFIVSDSSGVYFTRAGNVSRDTENNLHINGLKLMGWDVIEVDGINQIQKGTAKPISLAGEKQYVPPSATSLINMVGNLNALEDPIVNRTMEFYDSVGNVYTVDLVLTYHPTADTTTDPNATVNEPLSDHKYSYWDFEFVTDKDGKILAYPENDRTNGKQIDINVGPLPDDPDLTLSGTAGLGFNNKGLLCYDTNGKLIGLGPFDPTYTYDGADTGIVSINADNPPRIGIYVVPIDVMDPTATFGDTSYPDGTITYTGTGDDRTNPIGVINLDFAQFTQFEGEHTNAKCLYANGNAPGQLEDISVGADGKITGRYTNGMTKVLAQIPVAKFTNPAGLEKVGNNLYVTTTNSGPFDGTGEVGDLMGGVLEMSNVDLSQEFTEMITTQRGFQANSRIITVSDDMLQELVNLKR